MKEAALDHYKSRQGNCAQSVALAWRDKQEPEADHHDRLSGFGRGQAPEGTCGALYAARELVGKALGQASKDKLTTLFKEKAGGYTACRDIRKNRTLPCTECVALAAELLDQLHKENKS